MNLPWNSGRKIRTLASHAPKHGLQNRGPAIAAAITAAIIVIKRFRARGPLAYFGIAAAIVAIIGGGLLIGLTGSRTPSTLQEATLPGHSAQSASASVPGAIDAPLRTDGSKIVGADGSTVTLTGVNWFGFETGTFAPHGLWARNYNSMLNQIVDDGFNTVRLPYSDQLFQSGNTPNGINYQLNPDLKGLKGLDLMDKIVNAATSRGLAVILDQHRPDQYAQSDLPASNDLSTQQWISDWTMLAHHYANNPLVIGADLHNEPHGTATWGSGNPQTDWRLMAEQAGNAVLSVNPHWLIFVEGVDNYHNQSYWWGGDLQGAKTHPVVLSQPDHLVYSAHDYGPSVFGQNWFSAKNFPENMPAIWTKEWAYLAENGTAPVWLGEFGGQLSTPGEYKYEQALVAFLKQHHISYTYWCMNPDSGDTGGILNYDWRTQNQQKLDLLHTYQSPLPQALKQGIKDTAQS